MKKAIVTIEKKETYYEMEYTKVKEYTYTAETEEQVMSEIYRHHRHEAGVIKVKVVEVK